MNISLFSQYYLNLFPIQPYETILNLQFYSPTVSGSRVIPQKPQEIGLGVAQSAAGHPGCAEALGLGGEFR